MKGGEGGEGQEWDQTEKITLNALIFFGKLSNINWDFLGIVEGF